MLQNCTTGSLLNSVRATCDDDNNDKSVTALYDYAADRKMKRIGGATCCQLFGMTGMI